MSAVLCKANMPQTFCSSLSCLLKVFRRWASDCTVSLKHSSLQVLTPVGTSLPDLVITPRLLRGTSTRTAQQITIVSIESSCQTSRSVNMMHAQDGTFPAAQHAWRPLAANILTQTPEHMRISCHAPQQSQLMPRRQDSSMCHAFFAVSAIIAGILSSVGSSHEHIT